jgi:hypothetical protein
MERVDGTLRTSFSAIPAMCTSRPCCLPQCHTSLDDVGDWYFELEKRPYSTSTRFDLKLKITPELLQEIAAITRSIEGSIHNQHD